MSGFREEGTASSPPSTTGPTINSRSAFASEKIKKPSPLTCPQPSHRHRQVVKTLMTIKRPISGSVSWATSPKGRALLARIAKTITARAMVDPGDKVLVAVSGGPDSVALLLALHALGPRWHLGLATAHLDHGLRPEAGAQEAAFVRGLAVDLQVDCFTQSVDVGAYAVRAGLGIEEAGRAVRYGFLEQTAQDHGFNRIAVGHTADDNAELILMNLLRGAGPTGLSGIAAVRPPLVIRPLIETRRHQILALLAVAGATYLTDPSNADQRFTRNRIRGQLLPLLESRFNPQTALVLNRLGRIMSEENAFFDRLATDRLDQATRERNTERIQLDLKQITGCHPALQRRIVRQAVAAVKTDLRRIGFVHVEAVLGLIRGRTGGALHLPDQVLVRRRGAVLSVSRETTPLRSAGRTFACLMPDK